MSAATQVRERGIPFTDAMVRAILDGRKTQTRRVVKPQPERRVIEGLGGITKGMDPADDGAVWYDADGVAPGREMRCPYGRVGDRLYVREGWATNDWYDDTPPRDMNPEDAPLYYRARDSDRAYPARGRWRPPMFMPKWAARIWLEVTGVRVERVQDISEADAEAEGIERGSCSHPDCFPGSCASSRYRPAFAIGWDQINGARGYGWDANPWVWVVGFRRLEP